MVFFSSNKKERHQFICELIQALKFDNFCLNIGTSGLHKFYELLMIPICFFVFLRGGFFSSNGKKSDNLHLLSKLCNSAQFWPFHRKVRNDEKKCVQKNLKMGTFGVYLSSMLRHHRLKLTLDTGKMDICNIPTYCSTGKSIWLNITPLQICTFANIFWNIANIFRHICKHLEILKIPSSDGFLARWSATCTTRLMCMPQRWVSFHWQTENNLFRNTKCICDQITQHIC